MPSDRYLVEWLPIPCRPWRVIDTTVGDAVRGKDGRSRRFDTGDAAAAFALNLNARGAKP